MITGAEALMRALQAEGVETIFGYPGGAIMPVYDALFDYTHDGADATFHHVLVRHEQAAVHAAQGYARVSGRVGVAVVTSGPGATNTLTGVADAQMDSTPVVVIAGQVSTDTLGSDAFQEVDLVGVAQPISKWSYQIRRAEDVAWAVSRAFFIASSGRPGPVVLDFPKNAQMQRCAWKPVHICDVRGYTPYPDIDHEAVARAAELINAAQRPLALVGQGVELGNAQQELASFLEKADIPAGRTLLGLSALPSDHRLNMGMLGMHGSYAANLKTQECDVLIAIGMRFSDRVTGDTSTYARQAKIIHLDIDQSEIDKNVKTDVAVVADCKVSLPAITALLKKNDHSNWIRSFKPLAEEEHRMVILPAIKPVEGPLLMGEVVSNVSEGIDKLGADAVLVTDVGQNQLFASRYFRYRSHRSIVTSGGLGTMGFGLPAAVGAQLGDGKRMVVLFMGDGGMQMSLQELGTIMEQRLPLKMVLLNNNYLGNVRQWQDMFWNGRRSFTRMLNPHYADICRAYGIDYGLAIGRDDLQREIARMLESDRPFLLECAVKEEDNVLPMTSPGDSVNKMELHIDI